MNQSPAERILDEFAEYRAHGDGDMTYEKAKTQLRDELLERLPEKDVYLTTAEVKDIVREFFGDEK